MEEKKLPTLHVRDENIFFGAHNDHRPSKVFNWVWDRQVADSDVTLFMDNTLLEVRGCNSRVKLAWIVEPPCIHGHAYQHIKQVWGLYDRVFTFCRDLLDIDDRFRYCPWGTSFMWPHEWPQDPRKTKTLSIIASGKKMAPGHRLRHEVVSRYGAAMDVMGRGYRPVQSKLEGLTPYRYSMAIENSQVDSYWTEKLLDCFLCRTVPVFWGTQTVVDFFDRRGIIFFEDAEDLGRVLPTLGPEDYESRRPYIEENYRRAERYSCPDRNLWEAGVRDFFGDSDEDRKKVSDYVFNLHPM